MDHGGNTTNCTVCVDFLPVQISSRVCNIFCDIPTVFDEHNQRHEKGFKNVLVFFGNRILRDWDSDLFYCTAAFHYCL